jgi:predicted ATP-grasp superfamily ATP-dependent carboligase
MQMQVFVYEYTCASGPASDAPSAALQAEGWAMLSALLQDFGRISGVKILTLLAERYNQKVGGAICRRVQAQEEEFAFRELAGTADFTLVIAPEFNEILRTRCRWVVESEGRLLGPSLDAMQLAGDKLTLSLYLRDRGIPTPESQLFSTGEQCTNHRFPVVWKPRYGAGSQATFLVHNAEDLSACADRARAEGWHGEALVQPFVPGRSASITFLLGPCGGMPLLPAAQHLSDDGRFHYLGGSVPLAAGLSARAVRAAQRALETIPDLQGYIGVDLVLGRAEDGSEDTVIEINPRPTTSYVGLRALAETNLAEALLRVVIGETLPRLVWRSGVVHFDANGTVQYDPWRAGGCHPTVGYAANPDTKVTPLIPT